MVNPGFLSPRLIRLFICTPIESGRGAAEPVAAHREELLIAVRAPTFHRAGKGFPKGLLAIRKAG
jgi:hypothetical protein